MPLQHPFNIKPKNRLWNLINPRISGLLVGSVLAAYPSFYKNELHNPVLELVPNARGVPGRIYALVVGFAIGYGLAKGYNWLRWNILKSLFTYFGWVKSPRSLKTKTWGALIKLLRGPQPFSTFQFQPYLPKQPLPTLDETLDRWLVVAGQLVNKDEFELTKESVEEFRRNEGPNLQRYLVEKSKKEDNWIYNYWLNIVYLGSRQSLAVHSNYCATPPDIAHRTTSQLARAAVVVHFIAQFEQLIAEEKLQPILLQGLVPLCMSGYGYLFNSTRVPGEYKDEIVRYPGKSHIIVIRKGKYYKVDLRYKDENRSLLSVEEIKQQLEKIIIMADNDEDIPPVAALTGQNRKTWAKNRLQLMAKNKELLNDIETAMFILSLDDRTPKDYAELSKLTLAGQLNNVWFDKCFNLVVYENGWSSSNVDHTVIDAMVNCTLVEYVLVFESYENGDIPRDPLKRPRELQNPERLPWDLTGMQEAIHSASLELNEMGDDLELCIVNAKYGKGFMKKQRVSPDGYIQMALQLAYYKLHKKFVKTYEPATGRMFLLGRTETINPISPMSISWVKAMEDQTSTPQQRKDLLKKAVTYQNKYRLDATVGGGCDRHLLALMCASRELGMDLPKIFMDKPWQMPYILSTSQTPTAMYEYGTDGNFDACNGGFGPSCHEGYGVCYAVFGDNLLNFKITSWKSCAETSSKALGQAIEEAMEDMKLLFSQ